MNGPPLMLYSSPLLTLMDAGMVVPVTVMALDIWMLPGTAPVTGVKPPWSTGWAPVVTVNVDETPPMVSTAESDVL